MRLKHLALAGGVLLLSAGTASAAVVTHGLNLRSGPGTGYSVIDVMPAGARVRVLGCGAYWCRVAWRGEEGYASSSYLAGGGAYAYEPPAGYAGPAFGFGFGWGPRWDWGWHRDWDRGWGWRGGWDDDD
jgi:uncharacterized protein YraI